MQTDIFSIPTEFKTTLELAFDKFHAENPKVYAKLVALALQYKSRHRRQIGIKLLIEVVRWHTMMTTTDPDFKINNNHAPFYSRLIMAQEADLKDFFRTREQRA